MVGLGEEGLITMKTGTLYGIGVGPGDPELITLKALWVLQRVPHIFACCSTKTIRNFPPKKEKPLWAKLYVKFP